MWAAYLFTALALVSLPSAIRSHDLIIIVGQNVQARTADRRAEQTYDDVEAVLDECRQLRAHLQAQDRALDAFMRRLDGPTADGA